MISLFWLVKAAAAVSQQSRGPVLGKLQTHSSAEIAGSKWSIGTETMDRNLTVFSEYARYLPPLGAKRARVQCGWGRCDHGAAKYSWVWLDQAVFGLASMGIKPWLELSYGNSNYPGGGSNGPGASVPNSSVALHAWAQWVTAVAERYSNVTDEFELWNEPGLAASNYVPYATLANWTCRALHRARAPKPGWKPQMFYGAMSGGYAASGPAFLDGTLPELRQQLRGSGLTLKDCVAAVTYHAYTLRPEDTHKKSQSGPACGTASSSCSSVEALSNTLRTYVPGAFVFQGECGAPSTWERGGAMAHPVGFNWSEVTQAKWNLRSMIGDAATPLVRYSSVFSAMDICYDAAPNNIGNYGLLAASCRALDGSTCGSGEGRTRTCLNKTVDHVKPAFAAVQSVMQLFDQDLEPVTEARFTFDCDRKPANATPAPCPAAFHATPPQVGMHCDLKNTTHLGGMQHAEDAYDCQRRCCADPQCNCWAFSSSGANKGCWLQSTPAPLQPTIDPNVSGGKVATLPGPPPTPGHATEGFEPVGHAFRNRTSMPSSAGITHVVVWDASPGCNGAMCDTVRETDRLTRCKVIVTYSNGNARDVAVTDSTVDEAVAVMLMNGTVHSMAQGQAVFQPERVQLELTLYDAPILVAQRAAMLPIVPLRGG